MSEQSIRTEMRNLARRFCEVESELDNYAVDLIEELSKIEGWEYMVEEKFYRAYYEGKAYLIPHETNAYYSEDCVEFRDTDFDETLVLRIDLHKPLKMQVNEAKLPKSNDYIMTKIDLENGKTEHEEPCKI